MTTLPLAPTFAPQSIGLASVARASRTAGADAAERQAKRYVRLTFALCLAAHVWLISAGWWSCWPQYTARYDLLARGFAAGQTHLLIKADPRHLALPDPYDPAQNDRYRQVPGIPDSCLYDGKFYLYWGPVPALILTPARWFLHADVRPGDQFLTFAFVQGMMLATAALLLRLRSRHFPDAPAWLPAALLAVAGLSAPVTCVLTRAAVYEAAIVGGQCFLLAGLYAAWASLGRFSGERRRSRSRGREGAGASNGAGRPIVDFVDSSNDQHRSTPPLPHGRGSLAAAAPGLVLAGFLLACAVGCRVSLAVAVAAVGLLVCGRIVWTCRGRLADAVGPLLAFGLPATAGAVALGAYNHARFGSWLEFGQRYQLAGVNLRSYPSLFGLANLWPGLWSYFLRPVGVVGQFPYLLMAPGDGTFPSFIRLPEHYESYERIGGLLWTVPIVWLVPAGGFALLLRCRRLRKTDRRAADSGAGEGGLAGVDPSAVASAEVGDADARWLLVTLVAAAALGFVPVLLMIGSSQRYLADLTPPLVPVLMALAARLADPRRTSARAARRWRALTVSLAGVSVAAGVLVAFEGYAGHFRIQHPELFESLSGPLPDARPAALAPAPAGAGNNLRHDRQGRDLALVSWASDGSVPRVGPADLPSPGTPGEGWGGGRSREAASIGDRNPSREGPPPRPSPGVPGREGAPGQRCRQRSWKPVPLSDPPVVPTRCPTLNASAHAHS